MKRFLKIKNRGLVLVSLDKLALILELQVQKNNFWVALVFHHHCCTLTTVIPQYFCMNRFINVWLVICGLWLFDKKICSHIYRFKEGGVLLWRGWYGTLTRAVWYFEEGGVVLWREWCGTLKRGVWYFEEGGVELWIGWCGTLNRVVCNPLNRMVWYFEEGDVVLWRGLCGTLKRVASWPFNFEFLFL